MSSIQGMFISLWIQVNSSLFLFHIPCPGKVQIEKLQEEVRECNTKIHQLSLKLKQQNDDILYLREELKRLLTELSSYH